MFSKCVDDVAGKFLLGPSQRRAFGGAPPRCVFGDAGAMTTGRWRRHSSAQGLWSVACPSPSRLTSGGFEVVRVLIDGAGYADTSAQFLVHADARVRQAGAYTRPLFSSS
jgi:hypothetical protein